MAFSMLGHGLWDNGAITIRSGQYDHYYARVSEDAHSGAYCLELYATGSARCLYNLSAPQTDFVETAYINPDWFYTDIKYVLRRDGANLVELRWDGTYWNAYVDGAKVADGSVATNRDYWQRIAIWAQMGSGGRIRTSVDGIPDIDYSGDVTSGSIEQVGFYGRARVDDWVFGTGGWPGDRRIDYLPVISDASVQMTPSTGVDNYACVDERPPSDDDYVAATADATDQYCVQNWDDQGGDKLPKYVTVLARVRKLDSGSDDKVTLGLSDGVNNVDGSAESLLTGYEDHWFGSALAPDGGAWTDEDIDALEARVIVDVEP